MRIHTNPGLDWPALVCSRVGPATPAPGTGASCATSRRQGKQIVDDDLCVGASERRDLVAGSMVGDALVAVSGRVAVDLETVLGEGEDPVLGNPAPRVQALLDRPVVSQ